MLLVDQINGPLGRRRILPAVIDWWVKCPSGAKGIVFVRALHLSIPLSLCLSVSICLLLSFSVFRAFANRYQTISQNFPSFAPLLLCALKLTDFRHGELNSLWPCNAFRHQRSWSTLVQVMACCQVFTWASVDISSMEIYGIHRTTFLRKHSRYRPINWIKKALSELDR